MSLEGKGVTKQKKNATMVTMATIMTRVTMANQDDSGNHGKLG